jgi:hypothetical protein
MPQTINKYLFNKQNINRILNISNIRNKHMLILLLNDKIIIFRGLILSNL